MPNKDFDKVDTLPLYINFSFPEYSLQKRAYITNDKPKKFS